MVQVNQSHNCPVAVWFIWWSMHNLPLANHIWATKWLLFFAISGPSVSELFGPELGQQYIERHVIHTDEPAAKKYERKLFLKRQSWHQILSSVVLVLNLLTASSNSTSPSSLGSRAAQRIFLEDLRQKPCGHARIKKTKQRAACSKLFIPTTKTSRFKLQIPAALSESFNQKTRVKL